MATHDLAHPDLERRLVDVPDHQVPVFEASGWYIVEDGPQRPDDTDPVPAWRSYAETIGVSHEGLSKRQLIAAVDELLAAAADVDDDTEPPAASADKPTWERYARTLGIDPGDKTKKQLQAAVEAVLDTATDPENEPAGEPDTETEEP